MTIEKIGLSKLLKILGAQDALKISLVRSDLREERDKYLGIDSDPRDFYSPFWADAKAHVAGKCDLRIATQTRIEDNDRRANLYPRLRDGFLEWLELERRSTNYDLVPAEQNFHTRFEFPELHLLLKIDNVMGIRREPGEVRLIYPYFCKEHALTLKWGRVGLWLMSKGFSQFDISEMEILDVMRGRSFSGNTTSLRGIEERTFTESFRELRNNWLRLRTEYGLP
jgi:hypothetical protein